MLKTIFAPNTRDLISQFVRTEFKLKYNNSVLGFIWVLIKPMVTFLVIFVVLSRVFPNGSIHDYPLYLLLGTVISGHFNEATSSGISSLLNKQNLILKVNFPRYIVILSAVLLPAINFFINLSIYFAVSIVFFQKFPGIISLIYFIFAYLMFFTLIVGFSLITSIWNVKLRDVGSIWDLVLQLVFWVTPIVYDIKVITAKSNLIGTLIDKFNPISVLLTITRNAFIDDQVTRPGLLFAWWGVAIIVAGIGYFYFKKNIKKIAEDF